MAVISFANFIGLADSIATQAQALAAAQGDGSGSIGGFGTGGATASDGAQNCITTIVGLADPEQVDELITGFRAMLPKLSTIPSAYTEFIAGLKALNIHVSGINAFCTDNWVAFPSAGRVAPEFKTALEMMIGEQLDGANTFSPVIDPLNTYSITGANAVTETLIEDIDDDNYYAANLILHKTSAAGAADAITFNFLCTLWDDTVVPEAVAVDASDAINSLDDIGGAHPSVDQYKSVRLDTIVCAIGSIGETWKVVSLIERTVVL